LRLAADRPKQYGDISWSVRGVIFFGTPHRGSGNANLSGVIFQVLKTTIPMGNFRADLIENLKRGSEELAEIAMTSVELLEGLKIISIYERKRLATFGVSHRKCTTT
jgi:ankyrin repeat domain-containing protein 50